VFTKLRTLTIGMAFIVGGVIFAVPASAAIPPTDVPLTWPNRSTAFCLGVRAGDVTNGTPIIVRDHAGGGVTAASPCGELSGPTTPTAS